MTPAILKSTQLLKNGVAIHFGANLLISMRVLLELSQCQLYIDTEVWCKWAPDIYRFLSVHLAVRKSVNITVVQGTFSNVAPSVYQRHQVLNPSVTNSKVSIAVFSLLIIIIIIIYFLLTYIKHGNEIY